MKIKDLYEIKNGVLLKKDLRNCFSHKVILPKDLDDLYGLDFENLENYGEIKNIHKNKLQYGDIIVENKEPFRIVFVDFSPPACGVIASSNFIILRKRLFTGDNYPPEFVAIFLKSKFVRNIFKNHTKDKLVVNQDEIGEIRLSEFSLEEQQELVSKFKTVFERKKRALELKKNIEHCLSEDNKRLQWDINKIII